MRWTRLDDFAIAAFAVCMVVWPCARTGAAMSRGRGKAPDASHTVSAKSLERWEMVTTVLGFVGSRGGGFQMHELARRIGGRREIDFAQLSLVELEVLRQALAPFAVLAEIVDRWVEQAQDDLAGAFTDASPAPSGDPPRP